MKKISILILVAVVFAGCKDKNANGVFDNYMKDGDSVYVTRTGNRYHDSSCKVVKNSRTYEYSLEEAIKMGKTPCKICHRYDD